MQISKFVENQRKYFLNDYPKDINFRLDILKQIKGKLFEYQQEILEAFVKDFNKCEFDVISTELSMIILEINYFLKNLKKLVKPKKVKGNLINFPSKSYIYKEPYGVTLIIAPWNYPLQLSLLPLVDSIASGNTVILKPSEISYNVSKVLEKMFSSFDERIIKVINGDKEVAGELLNQRFDLIFYTGNETVGKIVMEKASKHLTPVILELGGKSPCIIDKEVNLKQTVQRITWGKFVNAGQTCVAPDYILVHKNLHKEFIQETVKQIKENYYIDKEIRKDFTHIINERHLNRLLRLIEKEKVIFGGNHQDNLLEPTILDNVTFEDLVMQEEIFGPIIPIIEYQNLDELINILKTKEKPLALYIFSNNKNNINKVISNLSFGGGCINDVIMHLTNDHLPFGGIGNSGMGRYHGKYSFDAFTHEKSIFKKGKIELQVKYPPYTNKKLKLVKSFTKIKK